MFDKFIFAICIIVSLISIVEILLRIKRKKKSAYLWIFILILNIILTPKLFYILINFYSLIFNQSIILCAILGALMMAAFKITYDRVIEVIDR